MGYAIPPPSIEKALYRHLLAAEPTCSLVQCLFDWAAPTGRSMIQYAYVFILGLLFCVKPAAAGTITYFITEAKSTEAIGRYPNGDWEISGRITTDGTLGDLEPANIISFEIQVDGPVPHTFYASEAHELEEAGLVATATEIRLRPWTIENGVPSPQVLHISKPNPTSDCPDCQRFFSWSGPVPEINEEGTFQYVVYDRFNQALPDLQTIGHVGAIIATVPEPVHHTVPLLAFLVLAFRGMATIRRKLGKLDRGHPFS